MYTRYQKLYFLFFNIFHLCAEAGTLYLYIENTARAAYSKLAQKCSITYNVRGKAKCFTADETVELNGIKHNSLPTFKNLKNAEMT